MKKKKNISACFFFFFFIVFTLISINYYYCALSQNLGPPFLTDFFFKFDFKNVNVFMFFDVEPNFMERFLCESGFSNFGHVTIFVKRKFVFWPPF